jgi:hypothetical protein
MISAHAAHMEAAELYRATYPDVRDYLLYVSRPSPTERTRYVWTSGVRLGLTASVAHLARLLAEYQSTCPGP